MIDHWAQLRPVTSAALLTEFGTAQGATIGRLLRGSGIGEIALADPAVQIHADQELTVMRNLVAELGDRPGLGLAAGALYHASSHGEWGLAVLTSPTMGRALEVGIEFAELSFSFARISLEHHGQLSSIIFDDTAIPREVRRFHAERDLMATLVIRREVVSRELRTVRIEIPFPVDSAYNDLLGLGPETELAHDADLPALTFDSSLLELPLPQANSRIAALYPEQCADILNRRRQPKDLSDAVRSALLRRGRLARQEEIAADLSMSARTLRRRLAHEATSFQQISTEAFGQLAEKMLSEGLAIQQVAARLGYSDASAFIHAYKSWKNITPGRHIRGHRPMR